MAIELLLTCKLRVHILHINKLFLNVLFVGFTQSPVAPSQPSAGLNVDFESVFGNKTSNVPVDSGGRSSFLSF